MPDNSYSPQNPYSWHLLIHCTEACHLWGFVFKSLVFFGLNRKMWEIFYLGGRNWFGNTCPIFGIWFRYVWRESRNRRAFADIERTRDLRPKILFLCLLNLYHFVYKFLYFCDSLGYFKSFCMKYSLFNKVFLLMKKNYTSSCW